MQMYAGGSSAWNSFLFQALVNEVLADDKTFFRYDTDKNYKLIMLIMCISVFFNSKIYMYTYMCV